MAVSREVIQGKLHQGIDEQIYYKIDVSNWGSDPGSIVVEAFKRSGTTWSNVTATVLTGTASESDDVITLPKLSGLLEGILYRIDVKFTCSGNVFEAYFFVEGER